jgi:hypothetical protein
MNYLLIGIFFIAALIQTIRKGPGYVFAYVYLPVQLLLSTVKPAQITTLPDITSPVAVSYGLLIGMLISGRLAFFKAHLIDYLVVLCSISIVVTGYVNGEFWTIISATGNEALGWLIPYYMARLAFRDGIVRRQMGLSLCFVAMAMGLIGMIEFRLYPLFFSRLLVQLGMADVYNEMVLGRFGFFRAMVTAEHPIDLGNVGLLLGGLIPALCLSSGLRMRDWRVMGGIAGAGMILIASMSFSCLAGAMVAFGIYLTLRYIRGSEAFLLPGVVAAIIGGFAFTAYLLSIDINTIRPTDGQEVAFDGSYYVRVLIIQNSWNTYGQGAGLLGYGDSGLKKDVLGLDSVDNSYMLFLMRRGWLHLGLRIFIACAIAYIGWKMLRKARGQMQRAPAAALLAVLMGTMVSMYTVWFGFVYAVVWTCTLAMLVTMRQMMAERLEARQPMQAEQFMSRPLIAQPVG